MSSASAIPDSNPTRAQLRLVVLGQWVKAGFALARGGGGAGAISMIFQAIRLAILLGLRLSARQGLPAPAWSETAMAEVAEMSARFQAPDPNLAFPSDNPSGVAACLRRALSEMVQTIREALGLVPDRGASKAALSRESGIPRALGDLNRLWRRPPDRPPKPERRTARLRSPIAPDAVKTVLTPLASMASGRYPLGTRAALSN